MGAARPCTNTCNGPLSGGVCASFTMMLRAVSPLTWPSAPMPQCPEIDSSRWHTNGFIALSRDAAQTSDHRARSKRHSHVVHHDHAGSCASIAVKGRSMRACSSYSSTARAMQDVPGVVAAAAASPLHENPARVDVEHQWLEQHAGGYIPVPIPKERQLVDARPIGWRCASAPATLRDCQRFGKRLKRIALQRLRYPCWSMISCGSSRSASVRFGLDCYKRSRRSLIGPILHDLGYHYQCIWCTTLPDCPATAPTPSPVNWTSMYSRKCQCECV